MPTLGANFRAKKVKKNTFILIIRFIDFFYFLSFSPRQEYLGMQTKYAALESKSRAVVAQQNHAVSGATLALSDLSARLTDLVEQLIASYNISEQELEVSA